MSRRPLASRAVAAALLAGLPILTGCAAGQQATTQTERTVAEGGNINLGYIQVRNAILEPPTGSSHAAGSNVPLSVSLVNSSDNADALTAVSAAGAASSVEVTSTPPQGAASGSATPAPEATTAASTTLPLDLPAHQAVQLQTTSGGAYLELRGLTRKLSEAQYVTVTFTFRTAGQTTLQVPVSTGEYTAEQ